MNLIDKLSPVRFREPKELQEGGCVVFRTKVIVPRAGRISPDRMSRLVGFTRDATSLVGHCGDGSAFNDSPTSRGRRPSPAVTAGLNVAHAIEHITLTLAKVDHEGEGGGLTVGSFGDPRRFGLEIRLHNAGAVTPGTVTRRARLALGVVNDMIRRG